VTRAALLALALAAALPAAADDPAAILLGALVVEAPPALAPGGPLRVTLELNPAGLEKVATLRDWFPGAQAVDGRVTVALAPRAHAAAAPVEPAQRGPTFLVDYDRPEARAFRDAVGALGPRPSDQALARLVDGWIVRKNLTRGIDSAARVAARREGDCTEHAVLLAAAARLAGRAARVVVGIALAAPDGGALRGYGHAWTEIHDGTGWRAVDATPLLPDVRYLPLGALADEGPGYLGAAWAVLSPLDVRRVIVAPAP
jgi:transglutaminase-like putative cysteine protease